MSIADIVIIAIILLFAIIGLAKGFFKTLISLLGTVICLVASFFLAKLLVDKLLEVQFIYKFVLGESGSIYSVMLSWFPAFNGLEVGAPETEIAAEASSWGILAPLVVKIVKSIAAGDVASSTPIQQCLAMFFSKLLFSVIVFILIFIVLKIIVAIINAIATAAKEKATLRSIDRILGFFLGAAKGAIFVAILFIISGIIITLEFMKPVRADIEKSFIAKPVNEFITSNVVNHLNIEALTGGLIPNQAPAHTTTAAENSVAITLSVFATLEMFSSTQFSYVSITADNYDQETQIAVDRIKQFIDELNLRIKEGKYTEDIDKLQQSANEIVEMYQNGTDGLIVHFEALRDNPEEKETILPELKDKLKIIMEKYVADFTGEGKVDEVTLAINLA